jgi:purine-binding chemotaxis protein CheW
MVVRDGSEIISLLVESVGDVVELDDDTFERLPNTFRDGTGNLVTGIYKLDHAILHALDIRAAVSVAD